jgi:hypothetical protein
MQKPALFQPMSLGLGFDDFDFNFDPGLDLQNVLPGDTVFDVSEIDLLPIDYGLDLQNVIDPDFVVDYPTDYGLDMSLPENIAMVDTSGDVKDQSGKPIISAREMNNIARANPGRESEAIAKNLKATSPDWTKQFKSTDDLIKAAYSLFNTSKAVISGKPIAPTFQNPYVFNPNTLRPQTGMSTGLLTGLNSTNMLLIGGVALAAFLILRKK